MPHLDANALDSDPDGLSLLRAVIGTSPASDAEGSDGRRIEDFAARWTPAVRAHPLAQDAPLAAAG